LFFIGAIFIINLIMYCHCEHSEAIHPLCHSREDGNPENGLPRSARKDRKNTCPIRNSYGLVLKSKIL
jgi:hypothetical protein